MKAESTDVVVIGAGLGGLAAAGYLAKAGYSVTVLEHHAVPGGYAHEFRRGRYRLEVSLHALDGVDEGGWTHTVLSDLEVLSAVQFSRLDPYVIARFPDHDAVCHLALGQYADQLGISFPEERERLRLLFADMSRLFRQGQQLVMDTHLVGVTTGRALAQYPDFSEALSLTWAEYVSRFIRDVRLRALLSSLWGYLGLPPSRLGAAAYILAWGSYHVTGAGYPVGGSMAISRALEQTIKKYGGQIHYRQTVSRIHVQEGLATGVETDKGMRIKAEAVVSNASPKDTVLRMLDAGSVNADYLRRVEAETPSLGSLVIYLALDCELASLGWNHHELILFDTYDTEADYGYCASGDWQRCMLAITSYNYADPGCSPSGGSSLALMTLAPWDYQDVWGTGGDLRNYRVNPKYKLLKESAADVLIGRAASVIPGLREHIKYCDIATPLTNYRYTRNPKGAIYGTISTAIKASADRLSSAAPIPNLIFAGAWVMGGGMSAALMSGASAAIKTRAAMRRTASSNAELDPSTLVSHAGPSDEDVAKLLMEELGLS